jgi:hypothetical protein
MMPQEDKSIGLEQGLAVDSTAGRTALSTLSKPLAIVTATW